MLMLLLIPTNSFFIFYHGKLIDDHKFLSCDWLISHYRDETSLSLPKACEGLPHTQGIQGNSGNFQFEENLRETQGIFDFFK